MPTATRTTIPKTCPVVIIHAKADNDRNGNPRRCFVVLDHAGRLVETIDEGYSGTGELSMRWPWTNWHNLRDEGFDEPSNYTCYPVALDVPPAEYRRLMRREPDERTAALRAMGDRNARRVESRNREARARRNGC